MSTDPVPASSPADGPPPSLFVLASFVAASVAKVARLPLVGESMAAEAFSLEAGGKGFNLAVAARRLGAAVDGVMAVGTDLYAVLAAEALAAEGLPASMRVVYPTATGAGIGFVAPGGRDFLAVYPGANACLSAADVDRAAARLRAADMTLAQFELPDAPVAHAFALARAAGRRTLLNPSPFRPIAPAILAHTSILVVNAVELTQLADHLAVPAHAGAEGLATAVAARLFGTGPEILVVTLGDRGALLLTPDAAMLRQPAFPVEAVDTIGAGDAFTAGFAVALSRGLPHTEALRHGAACGAHIVRRFGILDGLPRPADLAALLAAAS
ncbi:PfkB family carbohydrate kinase [Mongoliimonas terrestris]|uniref:PfkB family carbohydrate kinase n=1 Tax=Mongoliimonas terrestris TaxID=1709001 RepID=UPI000AC43AA8|nr:PfkB family carbohydrate kinase [Mongoliimonas terrestris]